MKKFSFGSFLLFLCLTFQSFAFGLPPDYFRVYVPAFKGGLKFGLGTLFLRPSLSNVDYGIFFNNGLEYLNLRPSYEYNYELDLGYDLACSGNDLRLNYINIAQSDAASRDRGLLLESTTATLLLGPTVSDVVDVSFLGVPLPPAVATGLLIDPSRIDFIQFTAVFREDRLDFELGQSLHMTPDLKMRFFCGLTGAKLKNKFLTKITFEGPSDETAVLTGVASNPTDPEGTPFIEIVDLTRVSLNFRHDSRQESHFSGIGPRFGTDINYYLDIGISLFASGSTSLLVGNKDSHVTEVTDSIFQGTVDGVTIINPDPDLTLTPNLAPGDILVDNTYVTRTLKDPKTIRVVPNLEAKIGVSYSPCLPCTCSRVFIELGYMVSHYFNVVERMPGIETATSENVQANALDLTYDGVYLKFEMHVR